MTVPKFMTLNPDEMVKWCNARRKELNLSKAQLSKMTNVPESTLDRILSGKNPEFRYSTIQPIVAVLVQFNEETPEPDAKDDSQAEYYYNTIEGYKLILENKNHEIEQLKAAFERLQKECEFFRTENERKAQIISEQCEQMRLLRKAIEAQIDTTGKKTADGA